MILDYLLAEQRGSVLWPSPSIVPELALLGKLKLSYIRSLSKPLGFIKRWFLQWCLFRLVWVLGTMALTHTPNTGSYPIYSYHKHQCIGSSQRFYMHFKFCFKLNLVFNNLFCRWGWGEQTSESATWLDPSAEQSGIY